VQEERLQMVLDEYKQRYDRERIRLQEALVKAANCAQIVSDGLSECLAVERQLFRYSPEELRTRRSHPAGRELKIQLATKFIICRTLELTFENVHQMVAE